MTLSRDQLDVFLTYTERFERVMATLPSEAREQSLDTANADVVNKLNNKDCRAALVRYINLCSEEWYLARHELIEPFLWERWQSLMRSMLKNRVVAEMWEQVRGQYPPEFAAFFDALRR